MPENLLPGKLLGDSGISQEPASEAAARPQPARLSEIMEPVPSKNAFLDHQGSERYAALSLSLLADMETPISIFHRLANGNSNLFLLESVTDGTTPGRYSFMSVKAEGRFEFRDGKGIFLKVAKNGAIKERKPQMGDPLELLKRELKQHTVWAPQELPRFLGGAVGYIGFDCIRCFEKLPVPTKESLPIPEALMLLCKQVYIYDHLLRRLILIVQAPLEKERERRLQSWEDAKQELAGMVAQLQQNPPAIRLMDFQTPKRMIRLPIKHNRSAENMFAAVESARRAIIAGEIFQVVASMRQTIEAKLDPFLLYRALRLLNPSPYMFYFKFDDFAVVGASPEVLVRLENGKLLLRPIAGTRPRGKDPAEDAALEWELLRDPKELAEHRMLIDLGRNDLGRVAAVGSVNIKRPMHIERYSHVMHIVTDLHARLADGLDAFDAFRACFPAGTVSGAPKVRACELLAELEPDRRGLYAGAVGYFGLDGNMDTCIALRTMIVEADQVHIQAGAGLVYDSHPIREYSECLSKMDASLEAIQMVAAHKKAAEKRDKKRRRSKQPNQ